MDPYENRGRPELLEYSQFSLAKIEKNEDEDEHKKLKEFVARLKKNALTYWVRDYSSTSQLELVNLHASHCFACKCFAVWFKDQIIYPEHTTNIAAHPEMPAEIKDDFQEAMAIVDRSPRGAAALLRLAIQKLMPILGEKGKNISDDIGELVKKGLEPEIQRAMDVLRVVGNNAVHPGEIDLKDDKATAVSLAEILNLVIERRIATPKRIEELYSSLPAGARDAIDKRDKTK